MGLVSLLFNFNGRINRAQYWLGSFVAGFVGVVIIITTFVSSGVSVVSAKDDPAAALSAVLSSFGITSLVLLVLSWIGLALQIKRFHDRGRTGWLVAIPMALMGWIVASIIGSAVTGAEAAQAAAGIQPAIWLLWIVNLAFFVDLCCLPGVQRPNRFGDPPGSPRSPSMPTQPQGAAPASAANALFGVQTAMERAINEGPRLSQTYANAAAPRPAPPAPGPALARPSGGAPSFGRRGA